MWRWVATYTNANTHPRQNNNADTHTHTHTQTHTNTHANTHKSIVLLFKGSNDCVYLVHTGADDDGMHVAGFLW